MSSMVKTLFAVEPSNLNYTNTTINKKLQTATSGLQKYLYKQLTEQVSNENSLTIADYILAQKIEVNPSDTYRANILTTLITISKFHGNKLFKIKFTMIYGKPEVSDPLHKWIGSYNEQRQRLASFSSGFIAPG